VFRWWRNRADPQAQARSQAMVELSRGSWAFFVLLGVLLLLGDLVLIGSAISWDDWTLAGLGVVSGGFLVSWTVALFRGSPGSGRARIQSRNQAMAEHPRRIRAFALLGALLLLINFGAIGIAVSVSEWALVALLFVSSGFLVYLTVALIKGSTGSGGTNSSLDPGGR